MLDFECPMKSIHAYQEHFAKIADALLNHTALVLRKAEEGGERERKFYRICEVEFYLNDNEVHKDTFTHGDPIQCQSKKWYFHKFGSSYKSGTYKGLDLAMGKGPTKPGGILIRSLMPIAKPTSFDGK